MAKKKKKEEKTFEDYSIEELEDMAEDFDVKEPDPEPDFDDSLDLSINDINSNEDLEEDYSSSLQIAGDIHKLSPIFSQFPHLPKEVRYSFYDSKDTNIIRYKSRLYNSFKHYLQKIIYTADKELIQVRQNDKDFFNIEKEEELKEYFKSVNKQYLFYNLSTLDEEEQKDIINLIINQLKDAKKNDFVDMIYNDNDQVQSVFDTYYNQFGKNDSIDPFGIINDIITISESSKGRGGKMMNNMRTTISETKNVDLLKDNEDDSPEEATGFGNYLKNKLGKRNTANNYD